jgi:hypothetical protein
MLLPHSCACYSVATKRHPGGFRHLSFCWRAHCDLAYPTSCHGSSLSLNTPGPGAHESALVPEIVTPSPVRQLQLARGRFRSRSLHVTAEDTGVGEGVVDLLLHCLQRILLRFARGVLNLRGTDRGYNIADSLKMPRFFCARTANVSSNSTSKRIKT